MSVGWAALYSTFHHLNPTPFGLTFSPTISRLALRSNVEVSHFFPEQLQRNESANEIRLHINILMTIKRTFEHLQDHSMKILT